jgi:hypothetical protein
MRKFRRYAPHLHSLSMTSAGPIPAGKPKMNAISLKTLLPKLRSLGPYVLVELLLPGGTLIALLLWLSQGMSRTGTLTVDVPIDVPAVVARMA